MKNAQNNFIYARCPCPTTTVRSETREQCAALPGGGRPARRARTSIYGVKYPQSTVGTPRVQELLTSQDTGSGRFCKTIKQTSLLNRPTKTSELA